MSKYRHLQEQGTPLHETVLHGSIDRLNPILMTALTSALALIPLIVNRDEPGNEIQSPMAIVVLGGLVSSTLLNIYVMPIVYRWYAQRRGLHEARRAAGTAHEASLPEPQSGAEVSEESRG